MTEPSVDIGMDEPVIRLEVATPALLTDERARMKEYVERWKRLGPLLELQREEDVRRSNTINSIRAFNGLYENALAAWPARPTSGLVEQQRLFSLLPHS